jgi:predicted metal-dependent hydrolase
MIEMSLPSLESLPVEVVRSRRRKKTVQAYVANGRVRVLVPAGMAPSEEQKIVAEMVARASRRLSSTAIDLGTRAAEVARRYGLPSPRSIEWSDRQTSRWGSCSPTEGSVRISRRLAAMPGWVLDWVIVHELAHLEVPDHGPRFRQLVARYRLGERAEGYLIARGEIESG